MKTRLPCALMVVFLALAVSLPRSAAAAAAGAGGDSPDADKKPKTPLELVQETTEEVLDILSDPKLKGEENEKKRLELVRKAMQYKFGWHELAQRSLGRHWRSRTEEERAEFTALFRRLIEQTYQSRIEKHTDAELRYQEEDVEDEGYASVKLLAITRDKQEVPLEYRLRRIERKPDETEEEKKRPDWMVYDVKIEGVSLVQNYRSQFNDIIVGGSYRELVKKLKAKVGEDD